MPATRTATTHATIIAAPASRQGKTVFTAALARSLANRGCSVQVIKLGPDYLDPMILECASRRPVYNLDWWIMGEAHCRQILYDAARTSDVVLIESLMGIHDNTPSTAWLARTLGVPVTLVMDMARCAQTAVAVVHGMRGYAGGLPLAGVVGNRLGSDHHHTLVAEAFTDEVTYFGSLRRDERMVLPERHLGLVQGGEIAGLERQLDAAADCLHDHGVEVSVPGITVEPPVPGAAAAGDGLAGTRIAVARDRAFSFIYPANLAALESLGATIRFFSPLANEPAPPCDAIWLPGGYPELHLAALEANTATRDSIRAHCAAGRPALAECGGMMYLGETISGPDGGARRMCGVLAAAFTMHDRFQGVGHQQAELNGGCIRGHSFHHSSMRTELPPSAYCRRQDGRPGEAIFTIGATCASYAHFYFPSSLPVTAALFATGADHA